MTTKKIWDITPTISKDFPLWPGTPSFNRIVEEDMQKGDSTTCSSINCTVHLGVHADAPSHYAKDGLTIDQCSLEHYLGLCQVIRLDVPRGASITQKMVKQEIKAPRLLFACSTFDFTKPFQTDFASFDPDYFEFLGKNHVITVGIDCPSVDLFDAAELPCHLLAHQYNIALLENLDLKDVPEGLYELIALPLKIKDCDASPVRAILRSL